VVDLSLAFLALVILLDFAISLWNAYASGLTWTLLRNQRGHGFEKACAVAGLGLAFAGMAYATLIVLSWVALIVGFVGIGDFLFLVSFDFLVFGAMIIGFGLVITAQSIAIAYRRRNFGSIAVATWNVFTEILDVAIYAEGFRDASAVVKGDRANRANLYSIIAVAVGVAFILTYVAYRQGVRKGEAAIAASPSQSQAEEPSPTATPRVVPHHFRRTILVALVVLLVVVAAIVVLRVSFPSTTVNVREIAVYAPDNVCGLQSNPIKYAGFSDAPGANDLFGLQVTNFNSTPCTVRSVTTNTSGFGLSNVQVPFPVAGAGNGFMNVTIVLPSGSFDGVLALVYT